MNLTKLPQLVDKRRQIKIKRNLFKAQENYYSPCIPSLLYISSKRHVGLLQISKQAKVLSLNCLQHNRN
jgi:hypothetical protein